MATTTKPSTSFWVISILAIIWNLIGVIVYLGQAYMTDDMKALMTEEQLAIIENSPIWATAAFAIAVWFGLLGSILLTLRKKLSKSVLYISLLGVIVQLIYNFFMSNAIEVYGTQGIIQPLITLTISLFLVSYAKQADKKDLLS
ncbi:hypothetical protein [Polaribacter sp.]|jgi:uncharacterized protein YacL|uniref:hypothetical protein n=1 Tax=Polaribacter sp. TaxID=1920175 RepID=UPI003F6A0C63